MRKKLFLAATMALAMTAFAAPALADDAAVTATEGLTQMNDVYQIEDTADFLAFAAKVNGGETDADAILLADIDLTGTENYIPMGTYNDSYEGDFNGTEKPSRIFPSPVMTVICGQEFSVSSAAIFIISSWIMSM